MKMLGKTALIDGYHCDWCGQTPARMYIWKRDMSNGTPDRVTTYCDNCVDDKGNIVNQDLKKALEESDDEGTD
jgi:hypothetical protein